MEKTEAEDPAGPPAANLSIFINANREEIIRKCQAKFLARAGAALKHATDEDGVALFVSQLVDEVNPSPASTRGISVGASKHGRNLFSQGFTVDQVVHSFGDVCQSVTELAVQRGILLSADDFRLFNASLDNAIAAAVSEYTRQERTARDGVELGGTLELQNLVYTALTAFEALQSGAVGLSGSTGVLVHRSLLELRALVLERQAAIKNA
jgi:hypothetical protein